MAELIRLEHRCDERFKTIDLTIIEDITISWKAKGLHTYLISRPPGWKLWHEDLVKRSTDGKASLRSATDELRASGYLKIEMLAPDEKGRFTGYKWTVAQVPCLLEEQEPAPLLSSPESENQTSDSCPESDYPATGNPATGNRPFSKKQGLISNIGNKKQTTPSDKPKMKKEDLTRLTEKFAKLQGVRPRGKAWLPIQQGMKAMAVHEDYSLDEIEGCMIRMNELGWTWTMATLRRWIAAFAAGKMPDKSGNESGKPLPPEYQKIEDRLRMAHDPTVYDKQPASFLGPNRHWEDYKDAPKRNGNGKQLPPEYQKIEDRLRMAHDPTVYDQGRIGARRQDEDQSQDVDVR